MGWFQQVHAKSIGSQEIRALLVARKQLLGRLLDVELSIRGILRGFGLKVGQVTRKVRAPDDVRAAAVQRSDRPARDGMGRWASVAREDAMLYEIAAAKSRRGRTNAGGGLAPIRAAVDHRYFGRKASV